MIPQPPELRRLRLPEGLKLEDAQKHELVPAHVRDIEIEEMDERKERLPRRLTRRFSFKKKPGLDVTKFGQAMHASLKDDVAGYVLTVRKDGKPVYHLKWKWARGPVDGSTGWSDGIRMHVASVSKLLTAMGMVKVLDAANLSPDTRIARYLPDYWKLGPNLDKITFRHLLTHRSGFSTGSSKSDYGFMRTRVAMGVAGVGKYDYENMNFGLCRILIPIIRREVDRDLKIGIAQDPIWDSLTIGFFRRYMQANVFGPAGVSNVGFAPQGTKTALAYKFPQTALPGWNSGDLATMSGGAGFRLTQDELLDVMSAFRRGKLIATTKAQDALDSGFGIDQVIDTPVGKLYNKNGSWRRNGFREQSVAYFLPEGMEVAVFVNSSIGTEDYSLRGLVKEAYLDSIVD